MGYYTRYRIDVVGDIDPKFMFEYMHAEGDLDKAVVANLPDDYSPFEDDCKWYDWEKDMKELSKKFPDTIFELTGEGEESGDIWIAYFKGGKCQYSKATMTFEEYDEGKLQ